MATIDISNFKAPKKQKHQKKEVNFLDRLNAILSSNEKQLSDKKKEAFYHELGTLIGSGIDMKTALSLTASSFIQLKEQQLFEIIQQEVIAGKSLSSSLEERHKQFSRYEYYTIRIGEETGRLAEILKELAKYFKGRIEQRRKIVSALTYPLLVLSTSFAAVFFMISFVVPMFAEVFKQFGGELPYITKLILRLSDSFGLGISILLAIIVLSTFLYLKYKNTKEFKQKSTTILLRIPVIGDLIRKIYLARFANTMRLLTGTNTPLLQALHMVKQMIGFYPITQSLELAEHEIMMGNSLATALAKHSFYPVKFVQIIKIAEEVNKLEYFFEQLATQYTDEVTYQTQAISSLLEPLIIIFLGLTVGLILIAMYLPMFQLSNSF